MYKDTTVPGRIDDLNSAVASVAEAARRKFGSLNE